MPSQRISTLDGLRAFAVLLVFAHHVDQSRLPGGFLGVDLFFALSGYLITTLLVREFDKVGRVSLRKFYARRALRLLPALFVVVPVSVALAIRFNYGQPLRDGVAALLYLTDIVAPLTHTYGGLVGQTWSLGVEEQFYLVWPLLLLFLVRRRAMIPALIALILAFTLLTALASTVVGWSDLYRSPIPHVAELGAGALLSQLLPRARSRLWFASPVLAGMTIVGFVALAPVLSEPMPLLYCGGFTLIGLASAWLVGHAVLGEGPVARLLSWRPAVWLGERSYGFYLWHFPILIALEHHGFSTLLRGTVGLPLTLLATVLSWRLVEQPFLVRKQQFEPAYEATDVSTPA